MIVDGSSHLVLFVMETQSPCEILSSECTMFHDRSVIGSSSLVGCFFFFFFSTSSFLVGAALRIGAFKLNSSGFTGGTLFKLVGLMRFDNALGEKRKE